MSNVFDVLKERGYLKQLSHEDEIRKILGEEKVTFYIGFDPTADSLHIGHFIPLMVMSHMQRHGHKPIVLLGGGTAMVGDPSGKSDMRKMMTKETIKNNVDAFKVQMGRFIDFDNGNAIIEDNGNWLLDLNYVDFLRDVGAHFSVNSMLRAECFKKRLETGLSFLEFNYMLMQSYDFLELNKRYGCTFQLGGDDQWSNILFGADLIRRKEAKPAYAMTVSLLLNSEGIKMGKTEKGALWIDKDKTSPYDFYQYWRNVDDKDVERCLAFLTFLPMEEVRELGALEGAEKNKAKQVLAYEVTKIIHGEEEAKKAKDASDALFSGTGNLSNVPTIEIEKEDLNKSLLDILVENKIIQSKSEGKRLISQGGLTLAGKKVEEISTLLSEEDFEKNEILIKIGKKNYHRIILI